MDADSSSKNKQSDLSGRDRLLSNVLWGWGSYLVVIIAGFIMPRLIDRHVGQVNLGIWDFSWSLVSYLSYSSMGIGSSINRYVAKYRVLNDLDKLRGAVSSIFVVQNLISLFIFVGSIIIAQILPYYFAEKLGEGLKQAQWVIILLGASLAIEQAAGTFRGVITGCHRWDLHNILNVSTRLGGFLSMLCVLLMGLGLKALAAAYLFATILFALLRVVVAYKVCPELKISFTYANRAQAKKMVVFGWKSFVINMAPLLLVQTSNVFITGVLGPAALAVFSRAVALVRHMEAMVNRFSYITTPIASVLKADSDIEELKKFFCESCKIGFAITLPAVIIFIFFGNTILYLWMGEHYIAGWTLPLLAAGYLLPVGLSPAANILIGMNRHGKIGFLISIIMILGFCLTWILLKKTGWTLAKSTLLISIPLVLGNGILLPLFTCRILKISFFSFLNQIFLPVIYNIPLVMVFSISLKLLPNNNFMAMCLAILIGLPLIFFIYFHKVLPDMYKEKIIQKIDSINKKFLYQK